MHSEGSGSHASARSHSAPPDIVLLQGDDDDDDTTWVGEEDAGHSDDETLSKGTVSLPDISASNSEDACKAIVLSSMLTGQMNRSTMKMKASPRGIRGFMTMLM